MKFSDEHKSIVSNMKKLTESMFKSRDEKAAGSLERKDYIEDNNNAGKIISAQKTILESFKRRDDELKLCIMASLHIAGNPNGQISDEIKQIAGAE
ncbi:hypothetical protein LCGC14_2113020 [marine sediment metagenome]|uniref:Uncharacterized protein n=1 Tax=marine sediment metagenome TaxID=412755 RepID=A0A0F9GJN4_9ZZZZ